MIHSTHNRSSIEEAEKLLKEAHVHLTAIRITVLKEIMQLDHTFTLADMEEQMDTIDKSTLFCIKDIDSSQIPYPKNFEVEEINCVMKGLCPECKQKKHIPENERNI